MTQTSDKALLKRILAGNHEACVELVRQYHAPIYRLLVHLCRDAHLAEDLTQETFLIAWTKIATFKAASSLHTWLHTIAYRKFIDTCRRGERTVRTTTETPLDAAQSNVANPSESAMKTEQARRLHTALDRLVPTERDILVLHYLQGMSYQEMSVVLEEPTGTLKWRTRQSLESLRTALENLKVS